MKREILMIKLKDSIKYGIADEGCPQRKKTWAQGQMRKVSLDQKEDCCMVKD